MLPEPYTQRYIVNIPIRPVGPHYNTNNGWQLNSVLPSTSMDSLPQPVPRRQRIRYCWTWVCLVQSLASFCALGTIAACVLQYTIYVFVLHNFQWGTIRNFMCFVNLLLSATVVLAQVLRRPMLYLPFLEFNAAAFVYNIARFIVDNVRAGTYLIAGNIGTHDLAKHWEHWSYYAIYGSQFISTLLFWTIALLAYLSTKRHRRRRRRAKAESIELEAKVEPAKTIKVSPNQNGNWSPQHESSKST